MLSIARFSRHPRHVLLFLILLFTILAATRLARANPYPPYWGGTAVHYAPVAWPADSAWIPYTFQQDGIEDPRIQDPSNGGTAPQNYVNISSGCTDESLPSVYWQFDSASQTVFFRWRVEQIANTYATGPNAGSYASSDPWLAAGWSVLIDTNGDGYRDFAVQIEGSSGSPSTAIDRLNAIYSSTQSQSIDFAGDPSVFLVGHNPTAFVDPATNRLLNFQNSVTPTNVWPAGSTAPFWDYGTTRATNISTTCTEYFVDYQIPLPMLDATAVGGPAITPNTPFSMLFATANSNTNPLQKDIVFNGDYVGDPNKPAPFGDTITLDGGTIPQPMVQSVSANSCAPTTLVTQIQDSLDFSTGTAQSSVTAADFYYYYDADGNGLADDGNAWTFAVSATTTNNPIGEWRASWNSTALLQGQYLIGVRAVDAQGNITWSHLTQAEVNALIGTTPPNYANPTPTPGVIYGTFTNSCGTPPPSISKAASPTEVIAGQLVTFTITVNNTTSSAITVSSITDALPPGFSYESTLGGTLGTPSTFPTASATGDISWTYSPAVSVPGSSSRTLIFRATASTVTGTYSNVASGESSFGTLTSPPVQIGVGEPRLTIAKAASTLSAAPGDTITYNITYANDSPVDVTNAIITDILPTGLTFVSASDSGSYDSGTRTITWSVGDIGSGEGPYTVSVVATVDNPYPDAAAIPLVNTATIDSDQTTPASGSASSFINAPRPALSIQKDSNLTQVAPGGQVIFTITYANTGNATASGVTITDAIPTGFTFVSATGGGTLAGSTVTWNIGTVAAGASGSVTLTLQADNPYSATNPATNTATLSATGLTPVSDSYTVGITQSTLVCTTYYFHNQTTNVGVDGTELIANTTAPTSGTTAVAGPFVVGSATVEIARFYQDPAATSAFNLTGNATIDVYIGKSGSPQAFFTAALYSYNPTTGATTLIGQQESASIPGNQTNTLVSYTIPVSGLVPQDHRLLWIFTARTNHASQTNNLSVRFDSTSSPSESNVCTATPANLVVDKVVSSLSSQSGGTLAYTINFANYGQTDATGAQIVDTLPTGVTFVSATLNGSAITPAISGQQLTFTVNSPGQASGVVGAGESGTLVINVTVNSGLDPSVTSLLNSATLTSNETTPTSDTATTALLRPDVTISKSASPTLLIPGDTVTFTLTILNSGSGPATNVTINDVLPATAYFTYVAGSARFNGTTISPDPVTGNTLTYNAGTLAVGASAELTFQMVVALTGAPSGVTEHTNTATVSDDQTSGTRSSDPVVVSISTNPNLRFDKSITAAGPYAPGDLITYLLTVENIGSGDALDVVIEDLIPANTTYEPGSLAYQGTPPTGATSEFDALANAVRFSIPTLPGQSSQTMQFSVRVDNPLPAGTTPILNTATVSASNASGRSDSADTEAIAAPTLAVDKRGPASLAFHAAALAAPATNSSTLQVDDSSQLVLNQSILVASQVRQITGINGSTVTLNAPVTASSGASVLGSITYFVLATNTGDATATSVVLTDQLPANTQFVSASDGGTLAGSTVTWSIGSLLPGESRLVEVTVIPTAAGTLLNGAILDSTETTPVNDSVTTDVGGLQISKSTTTPVVNQSATGASATYVIEVANQLAVAANGVVVTDPLVAGFTYSETVSITGFSSNTAPLVPTLGTDQPSWGTFTIPANGTLRITFTVRIDPSVGAATYQNAVIATSTDTVVLPFDPLLTTDEDVQVLVAPVLVATKADTFTDSDGNGIAAPGETITYQVMITNTGTGAASGVVFSDTIDVNTTLVANSVVVTPATSGTVTSGNSSTDSFVQVDIGTLAEGSTVTITFQVVIDNPLSTGVTQIVNQGLVSSNELPPLPTDDPATTGTIGDPTITPITAAPVLVATKHDTVTDSDGNGFASPGETITYQVTITNTGTSAATGVVFSDTIPANTTVVPGSVTVTPAISGTVTSGNTAGATFIRVDIGTLAGGGASVTITFQVTVNNPLPAGVTQIVNQGRVGSNELAEVPTDDPATTGTIGDPTITPITAAPVLVATKHDTVTDSDGNGFASPGETITYQVTITNTGTSAATGVVFSDTIPANTTVVPGSVTVTPAISGTVTSGNTAGATFIRVDIGTLAGGGASVTITFQVTVNNPLPAGVTQIVNQGRVGSNELPPLPTDDPATTDMIGDPTITPVTGTPILRAFKDDTLTNDADANGFPSPGDTLTYQVTISNTGNMTATGIVFSDTVDVNTTLVPGSVTINPPSSGSVTSGNTAGDTTVAVNILEIAAGGGSVTITFQVTINDPLPLGVMQVANQGTVSAPGLPPVPTDDPSTVNPDDPTVTPLTNDPILSATKQASLVTDADGNGFPSPGDTLQYEVTIANTGNGVATGVFFTDTVDANTTLVPNSVASIGNTVTSGNTAGDTTVGVNLGTIAANSSETITFQVTINNPLPAGVTQVANQGLVSSNELPTLPTDDPTTPTMGDPTVTPVTAAPLLSATKQVSLLTDADGNGMASPGDTLLYRVTILNSGNSAATNVTFSDTPDANTSLVNGSVATTLGTVTSGNTAGDTSVGVAIVTLPGGAPPVLITFHVTIDNPLPAGVTQLANQGLVSSPGLPSVPTDDPTTLTPDDPTITPVTAAPLLSADKQALLFTDADGNGFASPGDTLLYRITIRNSGNGAATGVTFSDTPDANTTLVNGSVATTVGAVTSGNVAGETMVGVFVDVLAGNGGSATITFEVRINNPLPMGVTQVANQGLVSSNELPTLPTDDPATLTEDDPTITPVTNAPVLSADKQVLLLTDADGNGFASPGDTLLYHITIRNSGNSAASGVIFSDSPDANTTLVIPSVATTRGIVTSGNTAGDTSVGVNIGTLPGGGASATITFRVTINSPLPVGVTQVANQGLVSSPGLPSVPTNDPTTPTPDDPTITPVTAAPILNADKQALLFTDADGNGFASPGDTLLYHITIRNSGNGAATGVTFSDTPDANTTLVVPSVATTQGTVTSGNTAGDSMVGVNIGTLPGSGASATITFRVTINNPLPVGVTQVANQGLVSSPGLPSVPTNDPTTPTPDDPTTTPVTTAPILNADKQVFLVTDADGNGFASPGDTMLYRITIRNSGNGAATGVVFSDTIDVNTTLVVPSVATTLGTVTSGGTLGQLTVGVDVGTLPGGALVAITFRVTINNPLPTEVLVVANHGLISSNELPPVPTDDPTTPIEDDPTITPVTADPLLSATKQVSLFADADGNGFASPGDTLLYHITIRNSGNAAATAVTFSDTPGANTALVIGSVATTQGTITSGNSAGQTSVGVNIGTLPGGGASATITFRVTIDSPLPAGVTQVANQGTIGSNELPPVPTDDPATPTLDDPTVTPVVTAPVLSADKRSMLYRDADGNGMLSPGDELYYEITIINSGNGVATGVVLTDTPDVNSTLLFGTVQTTQGTVVRGNNPGDRDVEVNVGTLLAGGSRAVIGFRVTINNPLPSGVTQVVNQGILRSNETPPEVTNDPGTPPVDDPTTTPIAIPTAITLAMYSAEAEAGGVRLRWQTIMEQGTAYFTLVRAPVRNLDAAQPVEGVKIFAGQGSYEAFDPGGSPGDWYWLVEHHWSGDRTYYGPTRVSGSRLFLPLFGTSQ